MPLQELFLRHIDSIDGEIEVRAEPGLPFTSCHFGAFSIAVSDDDNRAMVALLGRVMGDPEREYPSIELDVGETVQCGAHIQRDGQGQVTERFLYLSSGPVHARLHFSTASLLVGALCEAHAWHQQRKLAAAGGEVASC